MSGDGGGANNTNPNPGGTGGDPAKDVVPKADHQRALDDMMKFKKTSQDLETANKDLKTRLEALENEKKTANGDYKGLFEQTKSQLDEALQSHKKLKDSLVLTEKFKAAQTELMKKGFKPEFVPFLERETFEEMAFETTSAGRIIVSGAEIFAGAYQKKYPSMFETGKPPVINNGGGASGGGSGGGGDEEITGAKLHEMELKCRAKGDMKEYHALFEKYVEQSKKKKQNVS